MHPELAVLLDNVTMTGEIRVDAVRFLKRHDCSPIAGHSMRVAQEARRLAARWGENTDAAEVAGWLHDISGVVSNERRIPLAESLGIEVLPEERRLPMIVHQKLSAAIARDLFNVSDETVLSAIGCHTTLKSKATALDKIVFVSDKIKWDQPGEPPYLSEILTASAYSLDRAACVYLGYLWERRDKLPVLHPWVFAAYQELCACD